MFVAYRGEIWVLSRERQPMSQVVTPESGTDSALTVERLKQALTRLGYSYVEDEENSSIVRARFETYPFTFAITGEHSNLLVVRGRWDQMIPVKQKGEATHVCNHWNMERMWPKVYVRRENDQALGIYGENVVDFHFGGSDQTIERAIGCSLTTTIAFFKSLSSELSDQTAD